jgi:RNA polymerase sigma factor (sigma-70 family)
MTSSEQPRNSASGPVAAPDSLASLELVRQWCSGDEEAARRLHDRYVARLVRLVGSRVGARFQPRFAAEDVVQSALASVFVRARGGELELDESGRLWPFLVQFTLNKLRSRIRDHLRQQRSVARECSEGAELMEALEARCAVGEDDFEEAEELACLLGDVRGTLLEETHRRILDLALEGHGVGAIARTLNRSERTVSRILGKVRAFLLARLAGAGS